MAQDPVRRNVAFLCGIAPAIHVLEDSGELHTLVLGNPLTHDGALFQALVPAGAWFAAQCAGSGAYGLVGCTVASGFKFQEFEIADKDFLLKTWPHHAQVIKRLARGALLRAHHPHMP